MSRLPFFSSGWTLPADLRLIATKQGLTARHLQRIEEIARQFHDEATRPRDEEVSATCAPMAERVRSIAREILDLPLPVRIVLWERYGAVQFHELVARLEAFAAAATLSGGPGRPHPDLRSAARLKLEALGETIKEEKQGRRFSIHTFADIWMNALDIPTPDRKTVRKFLDRHWADFARRKALAKARAEARSKLRCAACGEPFTPMHSTGRK